MIIIIIIGLDLVRRDWCELSSDVGTAILDFILNENRSREDVVNDIHQYLREQAVNLREGKVTIDKFVIRKAISKNPEEYGATEG
jgi:DNA polymerase alpha subunit A